MDLRLAVDPRLAATASMSSNSATIAAVDRDQRGARDRERVSVETASRGEGLAAAVAHSHVSSLPSEQSPSPWGVVRRYRQWRSLLWNGGERGKQDESSPLLVLWFTATTAGILGRRSYRCSIWVWVSAPPLPLEAAAWPLLPCRQNLPPWPPELRAEFLPLETLLPPCSTAVTVTGVFARDCHLGLLTEPLPGVRIRFAYATCSGFCFRESKPSRVLIVGDFGQSEKSSVDTLG
ncbi:uncharacterized protein DS421_11g330900 [Arachis hypogaea]|nr:uncharacterized protein DS421_11g330900 [Arachis hypogaea]